jgi:hypothetical protein
MFELKKDNLLSFISLILSIFLIIIFLIEFIEVVIGPVIWGSIPFVFFDISFFLILFLSIIAIIIGIVTVIKVEKFGIMAIITGIFCFIFNWLILLFFLSKLRF